uniref:Uncharacterized protein n=1 Tax=Aegilops tauschii subsp. strangulata TaxID=200361 RepID=A0A453LBR3_AEGTS
MFSVKKNVLSVIIVQDDAIASWLIVLFPFFRYIALNGSVENTEGQHRSYRRGHQGEHLIGEAVKEILLGKVFAHWLLKYASSSVGLFSVTPLPGMSHLWSNVTTIVLKVT